MTAPKKPRRCPICGPTRFRTVTGRLVHLSGCSPALRGLVRTAVVWKTTAINDHTGVYPCKKDCVYAMLERAVARWLKSKEARR
jgi:hypothetical protein